MTGEDFLFRMMAVRIGYVRKRSLRLHVLPDLPHVKDLFNEA